MVNDLKHMVLLVSLLAAGCSEKELIQDNPQESFAIAKAPYEERNYEVAIKKLNEFKSRFPYSRYAIEAELLIADSNFETNKFTEAGVAYEQFVKLHPKHEKTDLVLYRIGLCYWKDAPSEIDREQEYTQISIKKWERLIKEFPQSPHSEQAKQFIKAGKLRMAQAEDFIARFYCKKSIWHSCAYHSLIILERFPEQTELAQAAIQRASLALEKLAKEEPYGEQKNLFNRDASQEELLKKAHDLSSRVK